MLRHLRKLPTDVWGTAYLLLIPLFALIYWRLEDQFYQSTASVELAGRHLSRQAKDELLVAVKSFFAEAKKELDFPISDPTLVGLDSSAQAITFSTPFQITHPRSYSRSRHQLSWMIMLPPVPPVWPAKSHSDDTVELAIRIEAVPRFMTLALTREDSQLLSDRELGPIRGCFNPATEESGVAADHIDGFLKLPNKSYECIWRFHASHTGSLASVEGGFGRALYLSVVTITSLGYGDIVPLGGWARFWVGLEVLMGMVIIGFFINSTSMSPGSQNASTTGGAGSGGDLAGKPQWREYDDLN